MRISDWSSDVCSSDLAHQRHLVGHRIKPWLFDFAINSHDLADRTLNIDRYLGIANITTLQRIFDRACQLIGGLVSRVDGAHQWHGNPPARVHLPFAAEFGHVENIDADRIERTDSSAERRVGKEGVRT